MRTAIRQGIHVFVRKAVVDAEFRALLLARRAEAAKEIDLKLSPAEEMLLAAVPAAQVEAIIAPHERARGTPSGLPGPRGSGNARVARHDERLREGTADHGHSPRRSYKQWTRRDWNKVLAIEVVQKLARDQGTPASIVEAIVQRLLPSIRSIPGHPDGRSAMALGTSRIGGLPDLPTGGQWPQFIDDRLPKTNDSCEVTDDERDKGLSR